MPKKITPFLWFEDQAEEAVNFYASVFKNSKIGAVQRIPGDVPGQNGKVITMTFELDGQEFMALNGGPQFKFNESISMFVSCEDQAEVDRLWYTLSEGGEEGPCGWLKDKYGLSWQVVPTILGSLLGGPDPVKANAATQAMLKMKKLDIQALQEAYDAG